MNNLASLTLKYPEVFKLLGSNNICSCIQIKLPDSKGQEYMFQFDIFGTNRRKWSDVDVAMLRMVAVGMVNAISERLTD